jgi:hypothetical protein
MLSKDRVGGKSANNNKQAHGMRRHGDSSNHNNKSNEVSVAMAAGFADPVVDGGNGGGMRY